MIGGGAGRFSHASEAMDKDGEDGRAADVAAAPDGDRPADTGTTTDPDGHERARGAGS
jgi:hypothetical protein